MEDAGARRIFDYPFATEQQKLDFLCFYNIQHNPDISKSAVSVPWVPKPETDVLSQTMAMIDSWKAIDSNSSRAVSTANYVHFISRYNAIAKEHLPSIPLVFTNGQLIAQDIFRPNATEYILTSNQHWRYVQQYGDLATTVWHSILNIRNPETRSDRS